MARSAVRTVGPCHVSEMASPVPSPAGSLTAVTQSDMARSARRRVGPRHGERPLRLARWRGRRLGGRPRVRRPRLRALVPTGRPRGARRGPAIQGDVGGEKARPAAWEEGSWGAEGGDGEPSWTMVAPRFGGRYGGRGAVLGARRALLGRWGGGASPGRRGEPTRDFP